MRIVGIDPGKRHFGWALIEIASKSRVRKPLVWSAGVCAIDEESLNDLAYDLDADLLVVEHPWYRANDKRRVSPNTSVELAFSAGRIAGVMGGLLLAPKPHAWKGSVPKEIHHERLLARYPPIRGAVSHIKSKKRRLDALDACGLAAYGLEHRHET